MDFQQFFAPSSKHSTATTTGSVTDRVNLASRSTRHNGQLELRRAKVEDLPALTNLLTQSFHDSANQPFWLQAILRFSIQEDLRQRLHNSPTNHACWVAIQLPKAAENSPAKLVGTVELGLRSPLTLGWPFSIEAWLTPNRTFPYISNLAVAPRFRRQGIAQQLLQRCEQTAFSWKQSELYLHVLENNQAARNLYHLAGFGFKRVDPSLESLLFNRDRRQLLHKSLTDPQPSPNEAQP